jgi:hypothetical protein
MAGVNSQSRRGEGSIEAVEERWMASRWHHGHRGELIDDDPQLPPNSAGKACTVLAICGPWRTNRARGSAFDLGQR